MFIRIGCLSFVVNVTCKADMDLKKGLTGWSEREDITTLMGRLYIGYSDEDHQEGRGGLEAIKL